MTEEAAFVEALTRDTLDDATRGVYADWLEERGDPRAAFLRAEVALGATPGDAAWFDAAAAVPREGIAEAWAGAVAPRWEVWLLGYHPYRKIQAIKVIRELTGIGLREAKDLSEALPARVQGGYDSGRALRAAAYLREACGEGTPLPTVEVRRSSARPFGGWSGAWQPPPLPSIPAPAEPVSLWLLGYAPPQKIGLIKLVRELTGMGLAETKAYVERPLPLCVRESMHAIDAEALRERFAPWATVEVRS